MDPVDPQAPAPAAADTTPIPAVDAAVASGDYTAFEDAQRAELAGKPLAAVTPPEPAERQLSRRQQEANERTRKAVETATADLRAENERLRKAAPVAEPPVRREPVAEPPAPPAAEKFPGMDKYFAEHPEASVDDYLDARDDHREKQRALAAAQRTEQQTLDQSEEARAARVSKAFADKKAVDPDFVAKLDTRLLNYKSVADATRDGDTVTPGSIVLSEMMESDVFMPFAEYFSTNPDALTRLENVPDRYKALPPRQRAIEHSRWIVREMGKIEDKLTAAAPAPGAEPEPAPVTRPKTHSTAPAPPADLGRRQTTPADPSRAAVQADDYAAFEQAEFAKRGVARK